MRHTLEKKLFIGDKTLIPSRISSRGYKIGLVCVCVCVFICQWVYSGHIIHQYNGIWGTCAPVRRNMHHQCAICTMVHKGDYVF